MKQASRPFLKIALIGIYALVVWKGVEFSRFAWIKQGLERASSSPSRQEGIQSAAVVNGVERVLPNWYNVIGVRSDAVLESIALKRLSGPLKLLGLEPEAISILTVRPMFAQAWSLLAGVRLLRGQPVEQVAAALQNGLMLGPNEDDLVAERLVYGLIIWESLSSGAKERIAADLAIVGTRRVSSELANVRTILANKDPETRKDIRNRLERNPDRKALVALFGL